MTPIAFDELFEVNQRFTRSVSVTRDFAKEDALTGYILTQTGRGVLSRLSAALKGESQIRSWSLTGPYGAGKSAFALFAAQLLGGVGDTGRKASALLREQDAELHDSFFSAGGALAKKGMKLCPVLVTGSRGAIDASLTRGLAEALRRFCPRGRPPQLIERIERWSSEPEGEKRPSVVALFEEAFAFLDKYAREGTGFVVIIDELGKLLEHAATHPESGDVFVLQELAEAAARSERPFLLLTILHQALDRYAESLTLARRTEWAKVQGRFEDIPFEERSEQTVRLISQAIVPTESVSAHPSVRKAAKKLAEESAALVGRVGLVSGDELASVLSECFPLHPLTAVCLGPLFRTLAQNERSLFAFLVSHEPNGFQDFLRSASFTGMGTDSFRLDQLFDYVFSALGPSMFAHQRGRVWAEVQSLIERIGHEGDKVEIRLAKTIGLLQSLGPGAPIQPNKAVLRAAAAGSHVAEKDIDAAIDRLTKRSQVVFRRHLGSYALWEGSDFDVDAALKKARATLAADASLAGFLTRELPPRPHVARRHYFQKGTLRFFETRYVDGDGLAACLEQPLGEADGIVLYCLPRGPEERSALIGALRKKVGATRPVLAAVPRDLSDLRSACQDVGALRWLIKNAPELTNDRIARREVLSRLAHAEGSLKQTLDRAFTPEPTSRTVWFYHGAEETLLSTRALNELLSRVCDHVYPSTPEWRNELVNRRALSSSAAAARRNLIEAMIENSDKEDLGFTGMPPERCMYLTLLKATRLHRVKAGVWGYHVPDATAGRAMQQLWAAIGEFLASTRTHRRRVDEFFGVFREPPYGLKDGVIPVILAASLLYYAGEVAVYEEGTFVPRMTVAAFERMLHGPERFEVQQFRITGPRAEVFERYASMLTRTDRDSGQTTLLGVVRPLVRLVRDLPDYVTKTQQLSTEAQQIQRAIREAREPDRLLFTDLPVACGFSPFTPGGKIDEATVEGYFDTLRNRLGELQGAYPKLLAEMESLVLRAFERGGRFSDGRKSIAHQAEFIQGIAVDPKLKALLLRLIDAGMDDATWLESVAALLAGKPPSSWDDQDRARFEVQLVSSVRTFRHFEVLAHEMAGKGAALLNGDPRTLRVSITVPGSGEIERVVQFPPELDTQVQRIRQAIERALREEGALDDRQLGVVALTQITQALLTPREPKES